VLNINEDSIFVADAHFNSNRPELGKLLLQLLSGKIVTTQLFLMGDMFDFLSNEIRFYKIKNLKIIELLNQLSKKIDIVYLEGNHDFNIQILFPDIQVVPRQNQPLICTYQDKQVAISHGDIYTPTGYNIYTTIIRNSLFLNFLNFIDIRFWLSKKIDNWLLEKDICNECQDFNSFATNRISLYPKDIDIIIEGHFHYGQQSNNYINIPSLACDKKYFQLNETFHSKTFV